MHIICHSEKFELNLDKLIEAYHKGFKSNIESDEYPNHQGNSTVVGFW